MEIRKGYYVINHFFPERTREKLAKVIQLITDKKNLEDNDIKALGELVELLNYYTDDVLKKYSDHHIKELKSFEK